MPLLLPQLIFIQGLSVWAVLMLPSCRKSLGAVCQTCVKTIETATRSLCSRAQANPEDESSDQLSFSEAGALNFKEL